MSLGYDGTDIELVYASLPGEAPKYSIGIVVTVAGREFGVYADCGIVYRGDFDD